MSARPTKHDPKLGRPRHPTVLVVTPSYPAAPGHFAGHFVETRARALARDGHQVTVLSPDDSLVPVANGSIHRRSFGGGRLFGPPGALARIRANPLRLLGLPNVLKRARSCLLNSASDQVVFEWLLPFAPLLMERKLSSRYSSISLIAHGSDVDLLCRLPAPWVSLFLERLAEEDAHLTFVAKRLKSSLLERQGLSQYACSFVADATVEPAPISLLDVRPRASRSETSLRPSGLIVARLVPGKRVAEAIEAAQTHASVTVIGDGPEFNNLQRSFPSAQFLGQLSRRHTLERMARSDFLVSASRCEGAPTVVREARALGLPVAAREAGDLSDWANEDAGLFIAANGEPLEQQVVRLLHRRASSPAKLHGRVLISS